MVFCASRRRHTRCALVTGVQTCALPICWSVPALDGNVSLRTSAGTDQLRFDGGSATLPTRDPRLDRIAFSRGRFALEGPVGGALTLPEIGRASGRERVCQYVSISVVAVALIIKLDTI